MTIQIVIVAVLLLATTVNASIADIVVTSAPSFQRGLPRPGGLATVFCTGLRNIHGVVKAAGDPLPTALEGVQIQVQGIPAPILAVADHGGFQQVNFQVPFELPNFDVFTPFTGLEVRVRVSQDAEWAEATSSFARVEFFRATEGYFAVQHSADYSLVTEALPARPGEVLTAYATGLGLLSPRVASGAPAPADPVARLDIQDGRRMYFVAVNGIPVNTWFVGAAPGLVGVYQINFQVPGDAKNGPNELVFVDQVCLTPFGQACGTHYSYSKIESLPAIFYVDAANK